MTVISVLRVSMQNRNPLLLRATERSNENAKGKVKELIYLGREAA